MFRALIALLGLAVAGPALAQQPMIAPFNPSPQFSLAGPQVARGAVVWMHGSYDVANEPEPPPEPDWVRPLAARGYDMWVFARRTRPDPLDRGSAALLTGLERLREAGYRRVVVAGFSRGAFMGLAALARPELVDAVVAVSPAAHGSRPERRAEALAAYRALVEAARPMRFALALLQDDPWDPDPQARAEAARLAAPGRAGMLLLIDRPAAPRGHMGSFEQDFAARFGPCLAAFVDGAAGAASCTAP